MKEFGFYFLVFGVVTLLLSIFNIEFRWLAWVDQWGEMAGDAIRYGSLILGAFMYVKGNANEKAVLEAKKKKLQRRR